MTHQFLDERRFVSIRRSCFAIALAACPALAQTTVRASVSSAGVQGNDHSGPVSLSRDGRYCAYTSYATNLVAVDSNGFRDVFVRDLVSNTTTLVSTSSAGVQANGQGDSPTMSGDGRFVVFHSDATNLVASDTNANVDIFRKDRQTGTLLRVSVATGGAQANASSFVPVASFDGNLVAFVSQANNLVAGDSNNHSDIFVRDVNAGTTTRISVSSAAAQSNNDSEAPTISDDGRYVLFTSDASNLVASDTNGASDVFLRDRQANTTTRVSLTSAGAQANGLSNMCDISPDGGWVGFSSQATNLVANDTNSFTDVFVRELATGITTRVSVSTGGAQGNSHSFQPRLSTEARSISFHGPATNLVANDTNGVGDVFVRDRLLGTTQRVSVSTAGVQGNAAVYASRISADGRAIAFEGGASTLVTGDTNNRRDAFVHLRSCPAPIAYCTAGTSSNGCVPSISGSGTPSASATSGFTVSVAQMEGQKTALVFYGIDGRAAAPWGTSSSFVCVKSPTQRTPSLVTSGTAGACNGTLSLDWNAFIAANPGALGAPFTVGSIVDAQAWYRDPPSPKTTNLSNGLEFVVCP